MLDPQASGEWGWDDELAGELAPAIVPEYETRLDAGVRRGAASSELSPAARAFLAAETAAPDPATVVAAIAALQMRYGSPGPIAVGYRSPFGVVVCAFASLDDRRFDEVVDEANATLERTLRFPATHFGELFERAGRTRVPIVAFAEAGTPDADIDLGVWIESGSLVCRSARCDDAELAAFARHLATLIDSAAHAAAAAVSRLRYYDDA